ncbi:MAG TPA: CDP-alcohol phosphatidyltransferase family protein [Acidimicrobiales bacterium]|nr:CDP-alcohol phosphatidyltransferase family protein [Acidimicrobiales bacterium]
MTDAGSTFGPSALATPANALTVARLLAAPVFIGLVLAQGPTWTTVAVGTVAAGSDGLDGWLARRQGATRSGAFLDPLADKFLVLGALLALAADGRAPWLPVALMATREVAMSMYRSWAARQGLSVPARRSAKAKTLAQELAIASFLLPPVAHDHVLQVVAIWFATALTIVSGIQYLVDGRRALGELAP